MLPISGYVVGSTNPHLRWLRGLPSGDDCGQTARCHDCRVRGPCHGLAHTHCGRQLCRYALKSNQKFWFHWLIISIFNDLHILLVVNSTCNDLNFSYIWATFQTTTRSRRRLRHRSWKRRPRSFLSFSFSFYLTNFTFAGRGPGVGGKEQWGFPRKTQLQSHDQSMTSVVKQAHLKDISKWMNWCLNVFSDIDIAQVLMEALMKTLMRTDPATAD